MNSPKKTVVLGLGNPIMSDEGIGIRIIEHLQKQGQDYPDIDIIDAGTGGMSLLHIINGRSKAIIIDCAVMKTEPGTIRRFTPEEVKSVKNLSHLSLHEADILKVIELSKQLGECPDEIVFFGIEPLQIEMGDKLSEPLTRKFDEYIRIIKDELNLTA